MAADAQEFFLVTFLGGAKSSSGTLKRSLHESYPNGILTRETLDRPPRMRSEGAAPAGGWRRPCVIDGSRVQYCTVALDSPSRGIANR